MYPSTQIINAINRLNKHAQFELKDLLSNIWNNYTNTQKHQFGKEFNAEVKNGKHPTIKFIGKKSNHHATYLKL